MKQPINIHKRRETVKVFQYVVVEFKIHNTLNIAVFDLLIIGDGGNSIV